MIKKDKGRKIVNENYIRYRISFPSKITTKKYTMEQFQTTEQACDISVKEHILTMLQ